MGPCRVLKELQSRSLVEHTLERWAKAGDSPVDESEPASGSAT